MVRLILFGFGARRIAEIANKDAGRQVLLFNIRGKSKKGAHKFDTNFHYWL